MTRIRSTGGAVLVAACLVLSSSLGSMGHAHTAAAAAGNTLIYGSINEPDTLNPWTTQSDTSVVSAIFDPLLAVDATGHLQPDLATSVDHSADGRTWTFHLRHGVKWADGVPFTSADVAYNYRLTFDKKHSIYGIYGTGGWDQISSYSTPDAYTFVCRLKAVNAPFLVNMGNTPLVAQHIFDRPGVDFNKTPLNRAPIGTGAYMVSEWKAGDHLTLVPNPYWWGGQPFFAKVIFKIVPDRDTLLLQLKTGEVDMGDILQRQIAQARAIPGKRVVTWLNNSYRHVDLMQVGFLREQVVRQALDYATPKAAILKGISLGMGAIAYANVSPAITAYYNPNVPKHSFNLAKAAALLAADGFVKGSDGTLEKNGQPFALTLWAVTSDRNGLLINQVIQQVWEQLGIKVTLKSQPSSVFYGNAESAYFINAMAAMTSANVNSPDVDDSSYWISSNIPTSPADTTCCDTIGYFHRFDFQAQIDALYQAGNGTVDPVKRRAIYFKIQALLADEVPVIFLYWVPGMEALPSNLTGFVGNPFYPSFSTVGSWRRG